MKSKFLEKIIHTIIPHEKNGNIPHILREEFIVILVVFSGFLFYFNQNNLSIIKNLNLTATVYPAVIADLTNQDRVANGNSSLSWNTTLAKAAQMKADDMLKNSYFAHTSPNGITPWYWFKQANYNFIYAGENLAVDFTESKNVEDAWLNSPKHKENILSSNFTEIGIATSEGVFEGKNTTFVVELFGKPSVIATTKKPITNKEITVNSNPVITTPTVAGASAKNVVPTNIDSNLKVVEQTDKFIAVKNDNVVENNITEIPSNNPIVINGPLSTWYQRFIVSPTNTIKLIYDIILALVLAAVLLMFTKEFKQHHTKHLIMGLSVLIIVTTLLFVISTNGVTSINI